VCVFKSKVSLAEALVGFLELAYETVMKVIATQRLAAAAFAFFFGTGFKTPAEFRDPKKKTRPPSGKTETGKTRSGGEVP